MPKRASTPASSAEVMATGMCRIRRSRAPLAPTMMVSKAASMNAPTACAMVNPSPARPAVASTAAPGVDQAIITGLRSHKDGSTVHRPMPRPRAQGPGPRSRM